MRLNKSLVRTSTDKSESGSVDVVFPAIFLQRYIHTPGKSSQFTVSPSIKCKHPTLPHRHVGHLLRKTRETKARVPCTVMADHDGSIRILGRSVINANIKFRIWDRDLQSVGKERGRRNWCKCWIWTTLRFDAWIIRRSLHLT